MKITLLISIALLLFGCSNTNKMTENPPSVNLLVEKDKYS